MTNDNRRCMGKLGTGGGGQNPMLGMCCTSIFSLFIFIQNIVVLVVLMI